MAGSRKFVSPWNNTHLQVRTLSSQEKHQPKRKRPRPLQKPDKVSKAVKPRLHVSFPPGNITVICHPGLESVLARELEALGISFYPPRLGKKNNGKIVLKANPSISMTQFLQLHLYLGSASHIHIALAEFKALALGELERKVSARVQWNDIVAQPPSQKRDKQPLPCKIKVTSSKSRLIHTGAIRDRILQGINTALAPKMQIALYSHEEREDGATTPQTQNNGDEKTNDTATPKGPKKEPPVLSLVAIVHYDTVKLYLDTSRKPMHQRGYRLAVGKAPLREDLAYAVLYSAGWIPRYRYNRESTLSGGIIGRNSHNETNSDEADQKQHHVETKSDGISESIDNEESKVSTEHAITSNDFDTFLDPFCGSGTLAIEAASMRAGLPPGRNFPPPLSGTRWCGPTRWKQMVADAQTLVVDLPKKERIISCSDRDKGVVDSVVANAKRAGVQDWLDVRHCALSNHPWLSSADDDSTGTTANSLLIATNPPYGKRLSSKSKSSASDLLPLFQTFATQLKELNQRGCQYKATVLAKEDRLLKSAGFQFEKDLKFSNGGMFVSSNIISNPIK